MKIGIDARLIQQTGVGRYIRNLIREIALIDDRNEYVIFLSPDDYMNFRPPNGRWTKRKADSPWHSIREQLVMPGVFARERLDLVHVPYFAAPLLYPGKLMLTIHDLTIGHMDTGLATTHPRPMYALRRFGYWLVVRLGAKKASHILTVSRTVAADIVRELGVSPGKISVTYEGVDPHFQSESQAKPLISGDYFLFVGNAYPHKNLEMLLAAFARYIANDDKHARLVLVGKQDFFYKRLQAYAKQLSLGDSVVFFGSARDEELRNLYGHAKLFVFPSRAEGFGLPALEAVAHNCPVLCSDLPVFHEILGDVARYADTTDVSSLSRALGEPGGFSGATDEWKKRVKKLLTRYSWRRMAEQTVQAYERAMRDP